MVYHVVALRSILALRKAERKMSVQDREAVVQQLLTKLSSTRKAPYRSHATLLSGERGVGKSRLISQFTKHAQAQGISVVEVHCIEGDDRPHGPIIDCLNGLVGHSGQQIGSLPKVSRCLLYTSPSPRD